jgi:elongation factor G
VTIRSFPHVNPVISFALSAKKRGEEDKATLGLHKLAEEDLALHVDRDEESAEILVSGSGQLHVETACERLHRKYGVEWSSRRRRSLPRDDPQEHEGARTLEEADRRTRPVRRLLDRSGAAAARVGLPVRGQHRRRRHPAQFIPAVEKGVREALKKGTIAGYPVVDVKVSLYDGSTTTSTPRKWRSRSPARWRSRRRWRKRSPCCSSRSSRST